jgi:hypothetical protein
MCVIIFVTKIPEQHDQQQQISRTIRGQLVENLFN